MNVAAAGGGQVIVSNTHGVPIAALHESPDGAGRIWSRDPKTHHMTYLEA